MNLLHGIPDADLRNNDGTLEDPAHKSGGELQADRVITSPPFSMNYSRSGMKFPERFATATRLKKVGKPT